MTQIFSVCSACSAGRIPLCTPESRDHGRIARELAGDFWESRVRSSRSGIAVRRREFGDFGWRRFDTM